MGAVAAGLMAMGLRLQIRPYAFALLRPLQTAVGEIRQRAGWLVRLEHPSGRCGWGEVSPLNPDHAERCRRWIAQQGDAGGPAWSEVALDQWLANSPAEVAFALGAALAELQGLVGGDAPGCWLSAPPSAHLLPAGEAMPHAFDQLLAQRPQEGSITVKWKVAAADGAQELRLLEWLLERLPVGAHLRLDANGGWDRATAHNWVAALRGEDRLQWLEQPLAVDDLEGHQQLLEQIPVALDEGLRLHPEWQQAWAGWQVRRPSLEGDPRPFLRQLQQGVPRLMVSTAFETGIGARWLHHCAALQWQGATPAAPGLAPGWCPPGPLFSGDPLEVWCAAEAGE